MGIGSREYHLSMAEREHGKFNRTQYWMQNPEFFGKVYRLGTEKYLESHPLFHEVFQLRDRTLRCIDERTPGGIHMAGSGILLSLDEAAEAAERAEVDGICSHAECGAAALYAAKKGLDPKNKDAYAKEWAEKLAEKLHVPYKGHIERDALQGPADMHVARVAYYDGTGRFDSSKIAKAGADLPPGFVVSRRYLPNAAYAQSETEVSFNIATGEHGYGELITTASPFVIIPIGDPEDERFSQEALTAELAPLVKKGNGRILISGFTAKMSLEAAA